jgi:predicted acyltransferase
MTEPRSTGPRIASLDQFRGYTVAGMLLVNFVGGFAAIPGILKHHNTYCSYADTIMPQFFFAVGFAYRLTFVKRSAAQGVWHSLRHVIARNLGLILLGVALYHLDGRAASWTELRRLGVFGFLTTAFQRDPFQALVHIGLTGLWVLPVIGAGTPSRILFLITSAGLHAWLSSWFYFDWVWQRPGIDGGPLGFLTWAIPLLVGSLAYDVVAASGPRRAIWPLATWAGVLMLAGYALSCLDPIAGLRLAAMPFVPTAHPVTMWTMSQRAGTVSYLVFASGFSMAVYALFLLACDIGGLRLGVFRTIGRNALAAYVLHDIVAGAVKPYAPADSPPLYIAATLALFFGITYLFVRHLERDGITIRM